MVHHYESLLRDPVKLLESVEFDGLNPSLQIFGIQASIDSILEKVNTQLDSFDVSFSTRNPEERSSQYTAILSGRILGEMREMAKRPAASADETIASNIQQLNRLSELAARIEKERETHLENDITQLLREINHLISVPVNLPAELETDLKKRLMRQIHMHQQTMVDLLQIVAKMDSLTKFVLDAIEKHIGAVARAVVTEQKATASLLIPKMRTQKQQDDLVNKLESFLRGDIDGFTDKIE